MKKIIFILALLSIGCAHSVHQVHTSDFIPYAPIEAGEMIKSKSEQMVILGFTTETNYVNSAYRNLMSKCPEGRITGITTQFSTSLGFFSWTNKVLMQGLCLKGS